MSNFTEFVIESASFAWLESLGWGVKHGPDIAPLRRAKRSELAQGRTG